MGCRWIVGLALVVGARAMAQVPGATEAAMTTPTRDPVIDHGAATVGAPPASPGTALEGAIDPQHYLVGPGDRLLVELWGMHDLTVEVEVNAEGRLVVP